MTATISTTKPSTTAKPRPARPNLLDRYRPIGIASVLAAARSKAPA